jgi:hypothetical protein
MKELQDKIQEMEIRMEQSRSPQLKSGLNLVLAKLKMQRAEMAESTRASGDPNIDDGDESELEEVEDDKEEEEEAGGEDDDDDDEEDEDEDEDDIKIMRRS